MKSSRLHELLEKDEETVELVMLTYDYASRALQELRQPYAMREGTNGNYRRIPERLKARERFYKRIILATSEFLSETNNWYNGQETNKEKEQ